MRKLESGEITILNRTFKFFGYSDDSQFCGFRKEGTWGEFDLHHFSQIVRPDSICLDLGANVGMVTLALSILCPKGHIYAFEASAATAEALKHTAEANRLKNVTVEHTILGRENEEIRFFDIPGVSTSSFAISKESDKTVHVLAYPYTDKESNVTVARTKSVDQIVRELNIPRIDFIKIDVEGAELDVLEGAKETLARFKPIVVMEFNSRVFTQIRDIFPKHALGRILETFDSVHYFKERTGNLIRIEPTPIDRERFLTDHYDKVADLLCCFDGAELHNVDLIGEVQTLKLAVEKLKEQNKLGSLLKRKIKGLIRRLFGL